MSYILDALKKAERERDIRQVPTLMAEHEPAVKDRKNRWAVFGILLICAGAIVWFALFLQKTVNPPAPPLTAVEVLQGAGETEARQPGPPTPSEEPAAKSTAQGATPAGSAATAPRAIVPGPRGFPESTTTDSARLHQTARSMAKAAQRDAEDAEDAPLPEETEKPATRIPAPLRATKAESPIVQASKEKPESLKEALNSMTLSILLYDENRSDRMVFINGRKYIEGDTVEDTYYIESITLDGAYLTYRGERALLRPKAR